MHVGLQNGCKAVAISFFGIDCAIDVKAFVYSWNKTFVVAYIPVWIEMHLDL